eukprot:CCRYP_011164-RA/>CCRYP_011164-RA protein AED:0.38 eAED:0.60 QI:382/0.5/0.66/1/0/0/3/0/124
MIDVVSTNPKEKNHEHMSMTHRIVVSLSLEDSREPRQPFQPFQSSPSSSSHPPHELFHDLPDDPEDLELLELELELELELPQSSSQEVFHPRRLAKAFSTRIKTSNKETIGEETSFISARCTLI